MKKIILFIIGIGFIFSSFQPVFAETIPDCGTKPDPSIEIVSTEVYQAGGYEWVRYRMNVLNYLDYPAEMFELGDHTCGLNTNASRTWVGMFDGAGNYLPPNVFCALSLPSHLNSIWFAIPKCADHPSQAYITLTDKTCDQTYTSGIIDVFEPGYYNEINLDSCNVEIDADNDGSPLPDDCDDSDSSIFPGAVELCDGKDNDCDGAIPLSEIDNDSDGYTACGGDCNDTDFKINPAAYELPGDTIDDNCDGSLGECDPNKTWKNHGQYVRCVAHETDELINMGILTQEEADALISSAAQSDVGK